MDRVLKEVEALRVHVEPRWNDERAARVYAGIGQLRRRRMVARAGAGVALAAAAAACVALLPVDPSSPVTVAGVADDAPVQGQAAAIAAAMAAAPESGTVRAAHRLRLADGSLAELFGERSELELLDNRAGQVALGLRAGRAHFDVVRNPDRQFSVQAGAVRVVVIGTRFEVELQDDGRVRVAVQRGRVRVESPEGVRVLDGGQARLFEGAAPAGAALPAQVEAETATADAEQPRQAATHPRRERRPTRAAQPSGASWRSLIQEGDYAGAHAALEAGSPVADAPDALMDAADAARLSGHPGEAVGYLRRVVKDHARSPVAPLAAFTLGRVMLDQLGQPLGAAEAFAEARALSPEGSLAQDALAREVEAASKAGRARRALELARAYVRSYPSGRRLKAVKLHGGL